MSELLLERLSKKKIPQKQKLTEIILEKGQIDVDMVLVDKTDKNYDINSFRRKLKKQRGLTAPVLFQPPAESKTNIAEREEVVTDTSVKKPVKLKKTVKLPGEEDDEIRDKQQKRKRNLKEIEDIVLEVPATLIEIDEIPLGDRLKPKEPSINIKVDSYYLNLSLIHI